MSDWDSMDELEPLDDTSLGLLASYREARGPSEAAEARMLAGLRARIAAETEPEPAKAVSPEVSPSSTASRTGTGTEGRARTIAIAAVAFAAGVALTLSLSGRRESASTSADPDSMARGGHAMQPSGAPSERGHQAPRPGLDAAHTPVEGGGPEGARSWPLSVADLATISDPEDDDRDDHVDDDDGMPQTVELPPNALDADDTDEDDDVAATARRRGVLSPDEDPLAGRGTSHRGSDPRGSSLGGGGSSAVGAWAPSLTPSPTTSGIGSAARNPAVGGSAPSKGGTTPSSGQGNNEGTTPSDGAPRDDAPAGEPPPPSDEPPPPEDPPPEEEPRDDEPGDDEVPLEEQCDAEHEACVADAAAYCGWNPDGCPFVLDFCHERLMSCMGGDPFMPDPPDPPEPEPYDCYQDYDMCMMDVESICILEKAPPEACEDMYMQCDEMLMSCEGMPPDP